jgi:O-antigen/teichoic acid export membrane protein
MRYSMAHSMHFIPNSIVLTSSSTFQRALATIFGIVVARLLKVENFGIYSVIMTFCAVGDLFSDLSLSQFAVREFPRIQKQPEVFLSRLIALKLSFAFIVYWSLQSAVLIFGYGPMVQEGVRIVSLGMFFGAVTGSFGMVFLSKEQPLAPSVISTLSSAVYCSVGIFFLWKGFGLTAVFWTKILIDGMAACCMFVFFRKKFSWPFVIPSVRELFEIIKQARPFMLVSLIGTIQQHVEILMLSKISPMPTNVQVSYFAAARGVLSPILIVSQSVCMALLPWMSERVYNKMDLEIVRNRVWKTSLFLVLGAGIPLVVVSFCLGEWIIKTVLGGDFLPAVATLHVLSFAYAIQLLNGPIANTMLCSARLSKYVISFGFIVFFRILLGVALIPKYGHLGAAYANLFGSVAGAVFLVWVAQIELR